MTTPHTPENPVTQEAADKFGNYVATWRELLSLGDWRVTVSEKRATRKVMAEVYRIDLEQRSTTIRLGKDFGPMAVTDVTLNELALHECLHIFLHELIAAAKVPDQNPDTLSSAEHRVINVLERLLADKA